MSAGLSEQARERMSGLVDGEGSSEELQQILTAGRGSSQAWSETLQSWHVYHLIGDVMRSDELAGQGRDELFLARLRERMADEPVVMAPAAPQQEQAPKAPAAAAATLTRRRSWRVPLAAAAGVMVVAGVAVMTGLPGGRGSAVQGGATLAQGGASLTASPVKQPPHLLTVNTALPRDPRLDQYLSAHKQFGGSSALGVPSGFLRSATYNAPAR